MTGVQTCALPISAGIGAIAAKPAVIHAGVAIAGVGGAATVSGGVIKIVKEK